MLNFTVPWVPVLELPINLTLSAGKYWMAAYCVTTDFTLWFYTLRKDAAGSNFEGVWAAKDTGLFSDIPPNTWILATNNAFRDTAIAHGLDLSFVISGAVIPYTTTAIPTTALPTTALPTTALPTTALPTTAQATTAQPTTSIPTTALPTTAIPTQDQVTTAQATTGLLPTSDTENSNAIITGGESSSEDSSMALGLGIGLGVGIPCCLLFLILLLLLFIRKKKEKRDEEAELKEIPPASPATNRTSTDDVKLIPGNEIQILKTLGQGRFGAVYKGLVLFIQ